jgi:cytidyltransferase-like protein
LDLSESCVFIEAPDMSLKQIQGRVKSWKEEGLKVVFATGVFDLLHIEHLRFLKKAKAAGDKLIVGIDADSRAREIKGDERPINSHKIRLEQLSYLKAVDDAFILPEKFSVQSDWENFMAALRPDIYAISSQDAYQENKQGICRKLGIDLRIVHRYNPNYSTSLLIAKLLGPRIEGCKNRYQAPIIPGHGRGRNLGFPTLNLKKPRHFPYRHGIYAGYVWLGHQRYRGAFHFGPVPVFGQNKVSLEVFLLNRRRDIKLPAASFQLVHYLRPIRAFPSQADLCSQIGQDIELVKLALKN